MRRALPDVPVSISSEVAPIWREYERGNTVIVDAYLRRLIGEFAVSLQGGLDGPRHALALLLPEVQRRPGGGRGGDRASPST